MKKNLASILMLSTLCFYHLECVDQGKTSIMKQYQELAAAQYTLETVRISFNPIQQQLSKECARWQEPGLEEKERARVSSQIFNLCKDINALATFLNVDYQFSHGAKDWKLPFLLKMTENSANAVRSFYDELQAKSEKLSAEWDKREGKTFSLKHRKLKGRERGNACVCYKGSYRKKFL